jgi:hypothetical protein
MNNLYAELSNRLGSLRGQFTNESKGARYIVIFDEFVSVNEFELALHALFDFLLEPTTALCDQVTLKQIDSLHRLMALTDDCVGKLHQKRISGSGCGG